MNGPLEPESRSARQLAKRALGEARRSPTAGGLAWAAGATGLASLSGVPLRRSIGLGLSVGVAQRQLRDTVVELRREVRSAAQAAPLASLVSSEAIFGDSAVEPDMGRLIAEQVRRRPATVVECGCGASTLLIGSILKRNGSGTLVAIENHEGFAGHVRAQVSALGLDDHVEIVVAPLRAQQVGGEAVHWYDREAVAGGVRGPIDLLIVDGPPSRGPWARWPAVEIFHDQLSPGATILLDDGRRRGERLTAFRWERSHDELDLYWIDTVKGTWKLVRAETPRAIGRATALSRRLGRAVNPRPRGFGLGQVRR